MGQWDLGGGAPSTLTPIYPPLCPGVREVYNLLFPNSRCVCRPIGTWKGWLLLGKDKTVLFIKRSYFCVFSRRNISHTKFDIYALPAIHKKT